MGTSHINQLMPSIPTNPSGQKTPLQGLGNACSKPTLRASETAQKTLAVRLFQQFEALKTYGKSPEALESVVPFFIETLAEFEPEQVQRALTIHAQRCTEFPTPADIVGLIRRGGKPPLERSIYVAIASKEGCDRSAAEWDYLRDFEREAMQGDPGLVPHPAEQEAAAHIIRDLKRQLADAHREIDKLDALLTDERRRNNPSLPKPAVSDRVQRTVEHMRQSGAAQADIDEFLQSVGVAA